MKRRLLLLLFCVGMIYSGVSVVKYVSDKPNYNMEVDIITATVEPDTVEDVEESTQAAVVPEEPVMIDEFVEYYNSNPDLIGWLSIPAIDVNLPLMYTPDDMDYYLHKSFDKEESTHGTLFVDCDGSMNDNTIIVYGHNMKDNSMFGALDLFKDSSFLDDNLVFQVSDLYKVYNYQIVAVVLDKVYSTSDTCFKYYNYKGNDTTQYEDFVQWMNDKSLNELNLDISKGDNFIVLSTCSYHTEDGRLAIVAKRL